MANMIIITVTSVAILAQAIRLKKLDPSHSATANATMPVSRNSDTCFCDICLVGFLTRAELIDHLAFDIHAHAVAQRNLRIVDMFSEANIILDELGGWERCFACGRNRIDTVVMIQCCRCNGNGDQAATPYGIPGVPWRPNNIGSNSRFVCLEHALYVHCSSCATPLGIEAYLVDPEALTNDESSSSVPALTMESASGLHGSASSASRLMEVPDASDVREVLTKWQCSSSIIDLELQMMQERYDSPAAALGESSLHGGSRTIRLMDLGNYSVGNRKATILVSYQVCPTATYEYLNAYHTGDNLARKIVEAVIYMLGGGNLVTNARRNYIERGYCCVESGDSTRAWIRACGDILNDYCGVETGMDPCLEILKIMRDKGIPLDVIVLGDGTVAMGISKRVEAGKVRPPDIPHLWIQQQTMSGKVVIRKVVSSVNLTDIVSKDVSAELLKQLLPRFKIRNAKKLCAGPCAQVTALVIADSLGSSGARSMGKSGF